MIVRPRRRSVAGGIALAAVLAAGVIVTGQGPSPAGATPLSWHELDPHAASPGTDEPDLAEGLEAFDTGGNTYDPAYAQDEAGDVRLRGIVEATAAPAVDVGTRMVELFTLPCAPSKNVVVHLTVMVAGSASPALLQVADDGTVAALVDATVVDGGSFSGIVPLDGIRFEPADPSEPCEP